MYIAGRLRTASLPSRTVMELAPYSFPGFAVPPLLFFPGMFEVVNGLILSAQIVDFRVAKLAGRSLRSTFGCACGLTGPTSNDRNHLCPLAVALANRSFRG